MNRASPVRRQNRKKNRAAIKKPAVIMPCSKLVMSPLLVQFPDEAVQQDEDSRERTELTQDSEVDGRHNEQIDHHQQVVDRQQDKANGAPEQQARAASGIASAEQPGAYD